MKNDGTVVYAGDSIDINNTLSKWENIVDITFYDYGKGIVGLKDDGTTVSAADKSKTDNSWWSDKKDDFTNWTDLVSVKGGSTIAAGLKSDGTVVTTYGLYLYKHDYWHNITAIAVGSDHVVGLRSDGTVVAEGENKFGECDVDNWRDIVAIYADQWCTMGLTSNGTVLFTGACFDFDEVRNWSGIISLVLKGDTYDMAYGLKSDGSIVLDKGWSDDNQYTKDKKINRFSMNGIKTTR